MVNGPFDVSNRTSKLSGAAADRSAESGEASGNVRRALPETTHAPAMATVESMPAVANRATARCPAVMSTRRGPGRVGAGERPGIAHNVACAHAGKQLPRVRINA